MPLQHAVLALLKAGPTYGFNLRRRFEAAVGPEWGGLNVGHLNQILERLRRDGFVRTTRVSTSWGPDRVIHEITDSGAELLEEWMAEPTIRTAGYRDDFILKVMAAGLDGAATLAEICSIQRDARQADLHSLMVARDELKHDALTGLTVQAAILHIRAELQLISDAEELVVERLVESVQPADGAEAGQLSPPAMPSDADDRPDGAGRRAARQ